MQAISYRYGNTVNESHMFWYSADPLTFHASWFSPSVPERCECSERRHSSPPPPFLKKNFYLGSGIGESSDVPWRNVIHQDTICSSAISLQSIHSRTIHVPWTMGRTKHHAYTPLKLTVRTYRVACFLPRKTIFRCELLVSRMAPCFFAFDLLLVTTNVSPSCLKTIVSGIRRKL